MQKVQNKSQKSIIREENTSFFAVFITDILEKSKKMHIFAPRMKKSKINNPSKI